jgi:hypothetical protein
MLLRLPNVPAARSGGVQISIDSRQKHSGTYSLRLTLDGRHNANFAGVCNNEDVSYARVWVFRYTSGKFNSQIHSSAWLDDIALIPDVAGNPHR